MILPDFTYLAPSTLAEASKLAKEYDGKCKLMAGGTDIIVAMKEHVIAPEYIIDIKEIPGLDYLDHDPEQGLRIGALTKLRTIEKSLLVQDNSKPFPMQLTMWHPPRSEAREPWWATWSMLLRPQTP